MDHLDHTAHLDTPDYPDRTVHYSPVQSITAQYSPLQPSTAQHDPVQSSTVQNSSVHLTCSPVQPVILINVVTTVIPSSHLQKLQSLLRLFLTVFVGDENQYYVSVIQSSFLMNV